MLEKTEETLSKIKCVVTILHNEIKVTLTNVYLKKTKTIRYESHKKCKNVLNNKEVNYKLAKFLIKR